MILQLSDPHLGAPGAVHLLAGGERTSHVVTL